MADLRYLEASDTAAGVIAQWRDVRHALETGKAPAHATCRIADLLAEQFIEDGPENLTPAVTGALARAAAMLNVLVVEDMDARQILIILGMAAAELDRRAASH